MPGCKYRIRDRVMVPTVDGVQGIITSCLESIEAESVYTIRWFDVNAVPINEHFKESDVTAAQPTPVLPVNEFSSQKRATAKKRSKRT